MDQENNQDECIDSSAALVVSPHNPIAVVDEDPMVQVEKGQRQAEALMKVVEKSGSFVDIQGNKYLKVEGWELIGKFNRVSAVTEYVKAIGDPTEGYEAKVNLYQDGNIIGSSTMVCGIDEFVTQGKDGLAKDNACMSMAQTRATSKAYRLNFSWVAVLAGFQATPAEEMSGQQSDKPNFCTTHDTSWFKKGKMKEYAHPRGEGEPWCNMAESKLKGNSAGPQDPNGTLHDMGDVMRRASKEFNLRLSEVLGILGVEDTLVNWKGTPDEAWESIQAWYAERNEDPNAGPEN